MLMASLTALIVDDEPLARQELRYLLDSAGDVSVVGEGSNGIEAVELIRTHKPDVIFLDVRMPGLDGFAVLRKLMSTGTASDLPQVVFATAFDQYAVKAFEVNAVDYLLKPFDKKRLAQTLSKVRTRLRAGEEPSGSLPVVTVRSHEPAQQEGASEPKRVVPGPSLEDRSRMVAEQRPRDSGIGVTRTRIWEAAQAKLDTLLRMVEEQTLGGTLASAQAPPRVGRVVVRTGQRLLLVDQKDVCFASIEEGRISVVTKALEGDSNVRTLEELAEQLDPAQFWRVHRSFLVNVQHIREVVPWFKSSYQLRMDDRNATEIPVSRSQTKRLRELFNL